MTDEYDRIKRALLKLTPTEQARMLSELTDVVRDTAPTAAVPSDALDKQRFKDGVFCPHCGSQKVVKNGRQPDGTQRYRCQACRKTFNAATRTVMKGHHVRNREKLRKYVHCMMLKLPLRKAADECEIDLKTSFLWRHMILDALALTLQNSVLNGIVEFDETFFRLSFKGHKRMDSVVENGIPLPAHKRGADFSRAGLGRNQVCVPVAVSQSGGFFGQVSNLGKPTSTDLQNVLTGHCQAGAVLCADSGRAIKRVAAKENLNLVQIPRGRHTKGVYGIQKVNSFHGSLKELVDHRFRGVATKYLNNYVVWNGFLTACKGNEDELEELLLDIAENGVCPSTRRSVQKRDSVPVLSDKQRDLMKILLVRLARAEYEDRKEALERYRTGKDHDGDVSYDGQDEDLPF